MGTQSSQVTAAQAAPQQQAPRSGARALQRRCECGKHTGGGVCGGCRAADSRRASPRLMRKAAGGAGRVGEVPPAVGDVLRSPGRALEPSTRAFMESRFGHDFSRVRIHTDARAHESARAVGALAYTVGDNIAFGPGLYAPHTSAGQRLLAHELTHVVQQSGASAQAGAAPLTVGPNDGALEAEAHRASASLYAGRVPGASSAPRVRVSPGVSAQTVARADEDAVGYTMRLGNVARTGVQFIPSDVRDTVVGPVTAQGGLQSRGASQLNVIIGENMTIRRLARQILPLWTTATPFTPPGAAAPLPLDIITEDELAQGLLVYNQTYLPVPAMTNWRSGLRFPLPVEVDETTHVATLHPLQIRALSGGFDAAWTPLLDAAATATTTPPAATLQADAAAFLARETTALARGIHLQAQALTNASAALPFIREVFSQLGAASFDVALEFMDATVNAEVSVLIAQRDGEGILDLIVSALTSPPAGLTPDVQQRVDRALNMLVITGLNAQAPPAAARTRAEKTITVDTLKLDGSTHNPAAAVQVADAILSQCNVRVRHGADATARPGETTTWLRGDTDVRSANNCNAPSAEERALFRDARTAHGLSARFTAYFAATLSGNRASGYSCNPSDGMHALFRNRLFVFNDGDTATLAHELGHILIDTGEHPLPLGSTIMSPRPADPGRRQPLLTDRHCRRMYNNA